MVSPQHRVLLRSKVAERMFGSAEILAPAKALRGVKGIESVTEAREVEYFHFLFDRHELVCSEGALTESLHTGPEAWRTLTGAAQAEIEAIFPGLADLAQSREMARPSPKGRPLRNMLHRIEKNGKVLCETRP